MMKHLTQLANCLLLALFLAITAPLTAQPTTSTFMTRFEGGDVEYAYGGTEAQDGNFVIGGTLGTGNNGPDACLIKMDLVGNPLWIRAYGGNNDENLKTVVTTRDGGMVFAGDTRSFGSGTTDGLLVKTDANGNVIWARAIGGPGQDFAQDVDTTSDGGCIVVGSTSSFGAGGSDVFAAKYSFGGNLEWSAVVGGGGLDFCNGVVETSDGGYLLSGATNSFGAGGLDIYLVKLDATGNLDWTQTVGGAGPETGYKLANLSDGQVVVSGITNSFGAGGTDGFLAKMDVSGNLTWAHTYGTSALDRVFNVFETDNQSLVATGEGTTSTFGSGDQQIFETDALGNLNWARHLGTVVDETGFGAGFATRDGGILMTGWDDNDEDFLITKTDSNGLLSCNVASISLLESSPTFTIGTGGAITTGMVSLNIALLEGPIALTEISYCSAILPIRFFHFSAQNAGNNVHLDWEMETDENIDFQSIERAETDGEFSSIGKIYAVGNASQFQFVDQNPLSGPALYRISVKGQHGEISYSEVREIHAIRPGLSLSLKRNGLLLQSMEIEGWGEKEPAVWTLLDLQGKVVGQGSIEAGRSVASIEISESSQGTFFLRIAQGNQNWSRKVLLFQ